MWCRWCVGYPVSSKFTGKDPNCLVNFQIWSKTFSTPFWTTWPTDLVLQNDYLYGWGNKPELANSRKDFKSCACTLKSLHLACGKMGKRGHQRKERRSWNRNWLDAGPFHSSQPTPGHYERKEGPCDKKETLSETCTLPSPLYSRSLISSSAKMTSLISLFQNDRTFEKWNMKLFYFMLCQRGAKYSLERSQIHGLIA